MNERHLYCGRGDFQGSIAEDGSLYDERHNLLGRIEGNDVYDTGGIRQGTIDASGKLWDNGHTFVGMEWGANFIGPSYRSTGIVRGDSFGEGRGGEYGALMLLKKRNKWRSGEMPDNNYEFCDDRIGDPAADDDDEQDDYGDDEQVGYGYGAGRNAGDVNKYHGDVSPEGLGCGCITYLLFVGSLLWYLLR